MLCSNEILVPVLFSRYFNERSNEFRGTIANINHRSATDKIFPDKIYTMRYFSWKLYFPNKTKSLLLGNFGKIERWASFLECWCHLTWNPGFVFVTIAGFVSSILRRAATQWEKNVYDWLIKIWLLVCTAGSIVVTYTIPNDANAIYRINVIKGKVEANQLPLTVDGVNLTVSLLFNLIRQMYS